MEGKDNRNNSKQILLSVIGIAILIVAVVGVSFAAFTYSRAGETLNTISTGTITMSYNEAENGISIENAVPMTAAEGKVLSGEREYFDFNVYAKIVGTTTIDYEVVAVKANTDVNEYCSAADQNAVIAYTTTADPNTEVTVDSEHPVPAEGVQKTITNYNKCNTIPDNNIRLYLEKETTTGEGSEAVTAYTQVMAPAAWTPISSEAGNTTIGSPNDSMLLASGSFIGSGTGTQEITDKYRLRMWVDSAYVVDGTARSYKVKVNVYGKGR